MTAPSSSDPTAEAPRRVVIGVVSKPHGIQGALRVKAFNEGTELFTPGRVLWLERPAPTPSEVAARPGLQLKKAARVPVIERVTVRTARPAKEGMFVVELEGGSLPKDPTALDVLRGAELSVDRSDMPALEPGEFYHCDLPGFAALDAAGKRFGTVREVLAYPSVDAIAIETDEGATLEVPAVDGFLLGVDLEARTVQVDRAMVEGDER